MKQFELGQYKGLNVKRFDTTVQEEEIQQALDYIIGSFDEIEEEKRNEPIKTNDYVIVDIDGYEKDATVPVIRNIDTKLIVGSEGVFREVSANLLGKKMGDTVTFETVIQPDALEFQRWWGSEFTFTVKIKSVFVVKKPELTEELIRKVEPDLKNLKDLKNMLALKITHEKEGKEREANILLIFQALVKQCKYEFDEEELDSAAEDLYKKFTEELKIVDDMELLEYLIHRKITADQLLAECKEEASRRILWELMINSVIEKEEINLTPDEIKYLEKRINESRQNGQLPEEFMDINFLLASYLRKKTIDYLLKINLAS
ncbi:FKBP-type peptidyl-prolyl cis-trans isomerase (trigger factor) [Desulfitobacterium sp. LBE]|uniref:trigger factor n=1 Tax=Desulfitobacterium sp. LBE TaxID=884086 RepID=UPI001199C289|nr:trigger factor [Desulfitobacterium sp. LBE]TWH59361.1 FKBP-type peptidyl-prolyl cis-trans isomerase (trigger factor) [Desulfitobacterium sp. LBE]